jgi:hypothetical protein
LGHDAAHAGRADYRQVTAAWALLAVTDQDSRRFHHEGTKNTKKGKDNNTKTTTENNNKTTNSTKACGSLRTDQLSPS